MRLKTKTKRTAIRKKRTLPIRKRYCRFCVDKNKIINYKEIKTMEAFVRERGKLISRRLSGNCARHQRRLTEAIKRARFLSLIPYACGI